MSVRLESRNDPDFFSVAKRLTNLTRLDLNHIKVTDGGLVHLNGLTRLKEPKLMSNDVTDAGLTYLHGLGKLSVVDLRVTRVTDAGVKDLGHALPSLKIIR